MVLDAVNFNLHEKSCMFAITSDEILLLHMRIPQSATLCSRWPSPPRVKISRARRTKLISKRPFSAGVDGVLVQHVCCSPDFVNLSIKYGAF